MANVTNATFRGFLIQARTMADNGSTAVGTFAAGNYSKPACDSNVSRVTACQA